MHKIYEKITARPKLVIVLFLTATLISVVLGKFVSVNYDMNSYLPADSHSTVSLDIMESEFDGGIPNMRVMIKDVTIAQAMDYKQQLEQVEGVSSVTWLDDSIDVYAPLEMADSDAVESYYKDSTALYSITIEEDHIIDAVAQIRKLIGDDNAMEGSAVSTAVATNSTVSEIQKIAIITVIFVLLVLILTTTSWAEPFVILLGIGVAVLINKGSNLIFGEISFVSNAAGTILQQADAVRTVRYS